MSAAKGLILHWSSKSEIHPVGRTAQAAACKAAKVGATPTRDSNFAETAGWLRLAHHRDCNGAPARFDVALQMKDLLPCAQQEFGIPNGHGERRAQHRCLQMGMPIAIVPSVFVTVV